MPHPLCTYTLRVLYACGREFVPSVYFLPITWNGIPPPCAQEKSANLDTVSVSEPRVLPFCIKDSGVELTYQLIYADKLLWSCILSTVYYSNDLVHISGCVYMIEHLLLCHAGIQHLLYILYYSSSLKGWSYLQRRASGSMLNSLRGSGKR